MSLNFSCPLEFIVLAFPYYFEKCYPRSFLLSNRIVPCTGFCVILLYSPAAPFLRLRGETARRFHDLEPVLLDSSCRASFFF